MAGGDNNDCNHLMHVVLSRLATNTEYSTISLVEEPNNRLTVFRRDNYCLYTDNAEQRFTTLRDDSLTNIKITAYRKNNRLRVSRGATVSQRGTYN